MNVYNKGTLIAFWTKHANCKKQLELWYNDVSSQQWKSSADVKRAFTEASIINRHRVVFNIKGNDYRLIAEINYQRGWLLIKFIGTHAEYDKVDAAKTDLHSKRK